MSLARSPAAAPPRTLDVATVYREHFDYVFTNLRRLGVPAHALEDACHDVFVVVQRRSRSWDPECAVRTWLYGVVRRVAADVRRSGSRHRRRVRALQTVEYHEAATDDVIADRRIVQDFLDALDVDKREVFILVELEEMTAREVAATLRINPNTAAARLRAARRVFAERLEATAAAEHEARMLAAARRHEPVDEARRARIWAGLAPLVVPLGGVSMLLVSGLTAAFVVATTAIVTAAPEPRAPPPMHDTASDPGRVESPAVAAASVAVGAAPITPVAIPVQRPSELESPPSAERAASPPVRATVTVPPRRQTPPAPAPAPAASGRSSDDLRAETELAGRVLKATEPKEILALVDEYRRRFANGFFADRLSARRIEALCLTKRRTLATTEHTALARRQPALAERAIASCDDEPDHETVAVRPSSG